MTDQLAPRATESSIPWVCIYCGDKQPAETDQKWLQQHIWECSRHPLARLADQVRLFLSDATTVPGSRYVISDKEHIHPLLGLLQAYNQSVQPLDEKFND